MSKFPQFRTAMQLTYLIAALALVPHSGVFAQQAELPPPSGSDGSADYLIGPGDSLNVFVWGQPELSLVVPVRPDGRISTPLVEDITAVGRTSSQLAREIESVLSEYIRNPQVTVIVQGFVGTFSSQIRVLGQVVNPGPIPYRDRMTLLDVVLEVGGLTEFAAGNRSKVVRTVDGEVVETRVKLERLLDKGDLSQNLPVQPGDVIVIPEAIF